MTSPLPSRPMNLVRDTNRPCSIVLARYFPGIEASAVEEVGPAHEVDSRHIMWRAFAVSSVCAAGAFFFFLIGGQNSSKLNGLHAPEIPAPNYGTVGPSRPKVIANNPARGPEIATNANVEAASQKNVSEAAPQGVSLPDRSDRRLTEFILAPSIDFQNLGPVQLKLVWIDPSNGHYDLALRMHGREFDKLNAKLNVPIKFEGAARGDTEVVVGAVAKNHVWGYLSEPKPTGAGKAFKHRRFVRRNRS